MSTVELKNYVDARSPEERLWLARYLLEMERQQDTDASTEFDRRMDELDAGKNKVSWAGASPAWTSSTVKAYILIEQERLAATVLHRAETGWRKEELEGRDAVLRLASIGVALPMAAIYERTAAWARAASPK